MVNDLVATDDGYVVQNNDKSLFLPNAELINVGCMNCVWRMHNQCPHNLKDNEHYQLKDIIDIDEDTTVKVSKPVGTVPICPEMIGFIVSLAGKDDTVTVLWEKFLIYKIRIEESEGYKDYMRLRKEIKESFGKKRITPEELDRLRMNETAAKIWWAKISEHALKSLQKVNDRDSKKDTGKKGAGIFSAKTINFNTVKQIEVKK